MIRDAGTADNAVPNGFFTLQGEYFRKPTAGC
ncbi:hypothetical protein HRbin08_00914 [bacterium HR08]|nr:hypothetical protein HRbin08_00914 [bacterium HR08]